MPAQNVHITHINDTLANIRAGIDEYQSAVVTDAAADEQYSWTHANDDAGRLYWDAAYKYTDISTGVDTYLDREFADLTARGDLYVGDNIVHYGDTDTSIYFGNDQLSVYAGGLRFIEAVETGAASHLHLNPDNETIDVKIGDLFHYESTNGWLLLGNKSDAAPVRQLHVYKEDVTTDAVYYAARFSKYTTGTPALTHGVGIEFEVELAGCGGPFAYVGTIDFSGNGFAISRYLSAPAGIGLNYGGLSFVDAGLSTGSPGLLSIYAADSIYFTGGVANFGGTGYTGPLVIGADGKLALRTKAELLTDIGAEAAGTAAGLMLAHLGESDPHPGYLTAAEGAAAFDAIGAAAAVQGNLTTHAGLTTAAHGGVIGGGGTLNYLLKCTPDGNHAGNSILYDNATAIGVGTTDIEAWATNYRALEWYASAIMGGADNTNLYLCSNMYYAGPLGSRYWYYKTTAAAGQLVISGDILSFSQAASGTVNTITTRTERLRIASDGTYTLSALGGTGNGYVKTSSTGVLSRQTGVPWADVTSKPNTMAGLGTGTHMAVSSAATVSSWFSGFNVLEAYDSSLAFRNDNAMMYFNSNLWCGPSTGNEWKYVRDGVAAQLAFGAGTFSVSSCPSGAANAAASRIQVLGVSGTLYSFMGFNSTAAENGTGADEIQTAGNGDFTIDAAWPNATVYVGRLSTIARSTKFIVRGRDGSVLTSLHAGTTNNWITHSTSYNLGVANNNPSYALHVSDVFAVDNTATSIRLLKDAGVSSGKFYLGAGNDFSIGYDGTNAVLTQEAGTGAVVLASGSGAAHLYVQNSDSGGNTFAIGVADTADTTYGNAGELFIRDGARKDLRINSIGKIGIGDVTTAISWPLTVFWDVASASGTNAQFTICGATDTNKRLHLGYDTTNNIAYLLSVNNGVANTPMQYTASEHWLVGGNVGAGCTTPANMLEVRAAASGDGLLISRASDVAGQTCAMYMRTAEVGTDTYKKAALFFERTTSSGRGNLHIAINNVADSSNVELADKIVTFAAAGNVGVGGTPLSNDKLTVDSDTYPVLSIKNTHSTDDTVYTRLAMYHRGTMEGSITRYVNSHATYPGHLMIQNVNAYPVSIWTNGRERMRITSEGDVCIGTTSASGLLHAKSATGNNAVFVLESTDSTTRTNYMGLYYAGVEKGMVGYKLGPASAFMVYNGYNTDMAFYTNNFLRLTIEAGGGVKVAGAFGCNDVTPSAKRTHVADPSGGTTVDSQARMAINAILATLEAFGLHATS